MVIVKDENGNEYKVKVGKIKYRDRCNILRKVVKVSLSPTGQPTMKDIDFVELERMVLKYAVKEIEPSPGVDYLEFIDNLPVDEVKKIIDVAMKLNPFQ